MIYNKGRASNKSIRVQAGTACHRGLVRPLNEDNLLSLELLIGNDSKGISYRLFAIADGIGGYEGGEIASSLALRILAESLTNSLILPGLKRDKPSLKPVLLLQTLTESVKVANIGVYNQSQAKNNGMGTTLITALISGKTAYIANIGDSRLYLLDGKQLRQVTKDHSLVADMVVKEEITPEEVYSHPQRNIITRCLGTQESVEVDTFTETLRPGNSLLLCSDGLWEMVRDNDIKGVLLKAINAQCACEQLVELANHNGGRDNISVIVIKVIQ